VPLAIVTGASRGIGRATAVALAGAGFDVALVARSESQLAETAEQVEKHGVSARAIVADVTDPRAVRAAVEPLERVEVLVNNAGTLRALGPLWDVEPDDWWADLQTSVGGVYNVCRSVVPRMVEAGGGRIVNVVSYSGMRPAPYQSAYGAAKAAVTNLTESLAASLAEHGVAAFAVAPGFTETAMTRNLVESDAGRRWLPGAGQARVVPVEQTTALVVRLASGGADALSGRLLHVLDDVELLLARREEIERDELYVPRVRRLPGT
jgi:NAD(P)-dependent dehydrogenase (short-subunit alcohol dehydrogenase family)